MTVFTDAAAKVIDAYKEGPTGENQDNPEWKDLVVRQMYTWWPDLFQFLDELSELPPPKNGDTVTAANYIIQSNNSFMQHEGDQEEELAENFLRYQNDRADQLHPDEEEDSADQIVPANNQASASDDETTQFPAVKDDKDNDDQQQ